MAKVRITSDMIKPFTGEGDVEHIATNAGRLDTRPRTVRETSQGNEASAPAFFPTKM